MTGRLEGRVAIITGAASPRTPLVGPGEGPAADPLVRGASAGRIETHAGASPSLRGGG